MLTTSLLILAPEITLSLFSMFTLMVGTFYKNEGVPASILWTTCTAFLLVCIWILMYEPHSIKAFNDAFIFDMFSKFIKILILITATVILAISLPYLKSNSLLKFEYPVLITLSVVGMLLMVSATDLMALYMGLELQSLSLYVIAAFRRDSIRSTEAGLKYFVLGALSSGLLLYGASLVYGSTGTTNFYMIATSVENHGMSLGLIAGLAFLIVGVSFKISVVPFHMWTPDVYEGSPTPVTAFFATAPKIAAMAMLVRLLYDSFGGAVSDWQQILIFLSVSSMFVGSIAAIGQQNIKRLMAYSSISHMGFALIGLASGTVQGLSALLIYMVIYVVANIGTFVFILNMEKDGNPVTNLASLNMYSKVDSRRSILIATLMLSLAGLPPFVGFIGKLYIFQAAVDANLVWLAVSGGIASVIGAFYYLRIVYLIYFGEVTEQLDGKMPMLHWFVLTVSALAMVFGTINIFGLEEIVKLVSSNLIA
jgi:NADH-quinone oxidoreductase subunit N